MKIRFRYSVLIFILLTNVFTSKAQQNIEDTIKSIVAQTWKSIDLQIMPAFNIDSIISAVKAREDTFKGKFYYAHEIPVNLSPENAGNWLSIAGLGKIWCLRIRSKSALTLKIHFSDFYLTKGTKLWVFNENIDELYSPLSYQNNQSHGKFVLSFLQGDEIGLVYFHPDSIIESYELNIDAVFHGYRDPFNTGGNSQKVGTGQDNQPLTKACEQNVYCIPYFVPSEIIDNDVRAVFMIDGPEGACTGSLLNTRNNTLEALFLTARHCIHKGKFGEGALIDLTQLEFFFNYSSPDCNIFPPFSPTRYRHPDQGATLIAQSNTFLGSDHALLKISHLPPPHFKAYYAGWSAALLPTSTSVNLYSIHQADGLIKKISRAIGIISISVTGKIMIFWTNGVTEQGSSGGPLYKKNGRVIGVLSGGTSGCIIPGPDFYGRFRKFYNGHQAARQALGGNLLNNRTNGGREILCYKGDLELEGNYFPAGDYQPDNHITLKAEGDIIAGVGNGLTLKNGSHFTFQAGGTFIEMIPGFDTEIGAEWETVLGVACTPGPQKWSGEQEEDSGYVNETPEPLILTATPSPKAQTVTTEWTTTAFSTYDYFTVERSPTGSDFQLVVNMPGEGGATQTLRYEAIDENPVYGISHYRVKQTGEQGDFRFSNIATVKLLPLLSFSVRPNPATSFVEITFGKIEKGTVYVLTPEYDARLYIFSSSGEQVYEKIFNGTFYKYSIDISSFSSGLYFVTLIANDQLYKGKFVKVESGEKK